MADYQQRDSMTGPDWNPPWLCGFETNAQKFQYCIGLALDLLLEKQDEAQAAKLPGEGDPTLIPLQAADRVLSQGPAESDASFIVRLKGAFQAWAHAGSRNAISAQLQAYLTNLQPGVVLSDPEFLIVGGNTSLSTWSTMFGSMEQGTPPARTVVEPANWDWDGENHPTRAWLVLFMHLVATGDAGTTAFVNSTSGSSVPGTTSGFANITGLVGLTSSVVGQYITIPNAAASGNNGTFQIVAFYDSTSILIANPLANLVEANNGSLTWTIGQYPYIGPAPVWGSPQFVWGTDMTWGVNCSPLVIQSIRSILKLWKSADTYYPKIIVSFGGGHGTAGSEFSPLSSQGAGNPDGTWGGFGKNVNGVWVPARDPINGYTSFCDGTADAIQCYEKNVG